MIEGEYYHGREVPYFYDGIWEEAAWKREIDEEDEWYEKHKKR